MDRRFRTAYRALSRLGAADGLDTTEYERVYREWVAAGKPQNVYEFIREAANRPVDSPNWPEGDSSSK